MITIVLASIVGSVIMFLIVGFMASLLFLMAASGVIHALNWVPTSDRTNLTVLLLALLIGITAGALAVYSGA